MVREGRRHQCPQYDYLLIVFSNLNKLMFAKILWKLLPLNKCGIINSEKYGLLFTCLFLSFICRTSTHATSRVYVAIAKVMFPLIF